MIKRGTKAVWHRPAYETTVQTVKNGVKQLDEKGVIKTHQVKHPTQDYKVKCFGVLNRAKSQSTALIMRHGKQKMIEVPISQLEEI